jgi:hypothetical protein
MTVAEQRLILMIADMWPAQRLEQRICLEIVILVRNWDELAPLGCCYLDWQHINKLVLEGGHN